MSDAIIFVVGIGVGTVISSVTMLVALMTDYIRENKW